MIGNPINSYSLFISETFDRKSELRGGFTEHIKVRFILIFTHYLD